jgi:hypothetical protein
MLYNYSEKQGPKKAFFSLATFPLNLVGACGAVYRLFLSQRRKGRGEEENFILPLRSLRLCVMIFFILLYSYAISSAANFLTTPDVFGIRHAACP